MTVEPRTSFIYQNLCFATAGHAMEVLTGCPLRELMRDRLWHPLGMYETFLSLDDALDHVHKNVSTKSHVALPYLWIGEGHPLDADGGPSRGHFAVDQYLNDTSVAGAGSSTLSTAHDYALYLRSMLHRAPPVSPAGHDALRTGRNVVAGLGDPALTVVGPVLYTLGWMSTVYENRQLFMHGGGLPGFGTEMIYVPPLRKSTHGAEAEAEAGSDDDNDRGFAYVTMGNTAITSNIAGAILGGVLLNNYHDRGAATTHHHPRPDLAATYREQEAERLRRQSETDVERLIQLFYPELANTSHSDLPPLPVSLESCVGDYADRETGYQGVTISVRRKRRQTSTSSSSSSSSSSSFLLAQPSPRTWASSHTSHISLYPVSGPWLVATVTQSYPKSELGKYPEKYPFGDEGMSMPLGRAKVEVDSLGRASRVGIEMSDDMVRQAVARGWRRERGMVWFDRVL